MHWGTETLFGGGGDERLGAVCWRERHPTGSSHRSTHDLETEVQGGGFVPGVPDDRR